MSTSVLPKRRTDYAIVQHWYKIAKFLAYTPITFKPQHNKTRVYVSALYPPVLFLIYLIATLFSFYERLFFIYEQFNISQCILDTLQGVVEFLFIEHAVILSLIKKRNWKKLMSSIAQLEQRLNWPWINQIPDSSLRMLRVKIIMYHLAYASMHVYDTIANWTSLSYSLAFIIFRFTTYYLMFSTLFITFICGWLRNRYLYLEQLLESSASTQYFNFSILHNESVLGKLSEFSHNYKSMYLIVQEVNAIFGTYFFFITICTVLEILNAVNYGMPTKNLGVEDAVTGVNVIYLLFYTMCNVQVVMSCNSILKCSKKIWTTCLILHQQTESVEIREVYLILSHFIQGLSPEFSAAGFWIVNQSVLSTLFSSVMTYLIIIIQFNMTLI
ncbi:uncharacterized protein [Euwallacea fornicatus]|uniref:uncharacterized protein n=1 Tax=Euwallacea fornicatus TaxID=995702 RepID=UPI00338F6099